MPRFEFDFACLDDAPELARLYTESMRGGPSYPLVLENPTDIFRIEGVRGQEWKMCVARDMERKGKLVAFGSVSYSDCYVNGKLWPRFPMIEGAFIEPAYRGGTLLGRAFDFLGKYSLRGDAYAQARVSVVNDVALGAFTSGRGRLPAFLPYGYHVFTALPLTLPGPERAASDLEIRRAQPGDVPAMQAFFDEYAPRKQLRRRYEFAKLGHLAFYRDLSIGDFFLGFRHGRIVGIVGTWDQEGFKATHFIDNEDRPLPPQPGELSLFLHCIVIEKNDVPTFASMIEAVHAEHIGSRFGRLALGLDAQDPLRSGLERLHPINTFTQHFLVTFGRDPRPGLRPSLFCLDAGRL